MLEELQNMLIKSLDNIKIKRTDDYLFLIVLHIQTRLFIYSLHPQAKILFDDTSKKIKVPVVFISYNPN